MISFFQKLNRRAIFIYSNALSARCTIPLIFHHSLNPLMLSFWLLLPASNMMMQLLHIENTFWTQFLQGMCVLIQYAILFQSNLRHKLVISCSNWWELCMIVCESFETINLAVNLLPWTEFDEENIFINWTNRGKSYILIGDRDPF